MKEKIQFIILSFSFMLCGILILTLSLPDTLAEFSFRELLYDDLSIGGFFMIIYGYGVIFIFNVMKIKQNG